MILRPVSSIRVYQVSQTQLEHINVNIFGLSALFFEDCFRGLCCLVWLAGILDVYPTALYSVIFLIFGDLIRGVDIFIKTSLGCWGWRSFSCTSCSGRGGDSAVFRFAGYTHIHSHCLVLLPLMSHFLKGKTGNLRKDDMAKLTEYAKCAVWQFCPFSLIVNILFRLYAL